MSEFRDARLQLIALVSVAVALGAMAVDHLLGTEGDESGLADPPMFAISAVLSLVSAAVLFGWLVPRERRADAAHAARAALVCSVVSVVPGIAVVWLGVPFIVAGAGVAVGLDARRRDAGWFATAAIVVGLIVLGLGTIAYAAAAVS